MDETQRRVDEIRRERSELENHVIDEYAAGRISRRDFVRRGTIIGMSIPLVSFLAAACGGGGGGGTTAPASTGGAETGAAGETTAPPPTTGGTLKVAVTTPVGSLNPVAVFDQGGLCLNAMTGEFLSLSLGKPELQPQIAESWQPNQDASQWTFKIRSGVTFNDGTPMTAKDVAASINRIADPDNKSNALSALAGVISKGGATATDDTTVVFQLDGPVGAFPYIISSDNYNAIIVPENSNPADWEKTFIGTGPWNLESYKPQVSCSLVRYEGYWGPKALADRVEITLFADEQARVLALQGKQVEIVDQITPAGGQAIIQDTTNYKILQIKSSAHRELSMRNDMKPFTDKRVRQAIALTLDRPSIVQGLLLGLGDVGNDSPFAPVFPSTDTSVPQRQQDFAQAKQLLSAAGYPNGFKTQMNVNKVFEVPEYAQLVQAGAKNIGVDIKLVIQDSGTYYGDAVFGKSPWLDSIMSLVDYGHRGAPNVFLQAPLLSDGTWNAAHFKNSQYDSLEKQFVAELDLQKQQAVAGKIEQLLLDETPLIIAYFYYYLSATAANVSGVVNTGTGQLFVSQASVAA